MTPAVCTADDRRPSDLWDTSSLRGAELDDDPTVVIPRFLLRRLLAETTENGALAESGVTAAAVVPRFEIVEIGPDDIADDHDDDIVVDDSAFEVAFEEMVREP
jgi:hypothetical protein